MYFYFCETYRSYNNKYLLYENMQVIKTRARSMCVATLHMSTRSQDRCHLMKR